jgi:ABC-type multidrug transport system ATPase subunit
MKTCPFCNTSNAPENQFCQQCGRSLQILAPSASGETVHANINWDKAAGANRGVRRRISVPDLFAGRQRVDIGRSAEADIYLPHSTVSRFHAALERLPTGLQIRDQHSVNGVTLNGQRVQEVGLLKDQDRVGIGPFLFHVDGNELEILDNSRSLRLQARNLEKIIVDPSGKPKKLLDNISLVVEPGEFVSLLGPSGSGKSTLMDCLNGRRPATSGLLLANGENFYQHYDSFRQSLGYVPQRDIVHTELSVYRALYYTALLRLPNDTDGAELRTRIEEVVDQMELGAHQYTLIRNLSGGQIKRVSLGAELIARPCLLFIDEATSGLDAGTEARMMRLFRLLADEGKSVICITHNVDNVALCNLILILLRGKLAFYGPPQEALAFFHVGRVSEIYDRLHEKEPAAWEREYMESSLYQFFVKQRLAATERMQEWQVPEKEPDESAPERETSGVFTPLLNAVSSIRPRALIQPNTSQFWVLCRRNLELLWRDRATLRLVALQAPIVALFILLGFVTKDYDERILAPRRVTAEEKKGLEIMNKAALEAYKFKEKDIEAMDPGGKIKNYAGILKEAIEANTPLIPDKFIINPLPSYTLVFLVVIIILWFGCNNSAKEIVKEDAVYQRERAVNLGILPYLSSKFAVLSVITALQTLLLMLMIYGGLELSHAIFGGSRPNAAYVLDYPQQFGVLVLLGMTGVALGLFLSSVVRNPDQANTLLPYVLIPQVILGGGVLVIRSGTLLSWVAMLLSPVYWAYRAARTGETELPDVLPMHMDYDDTLWLPCAVLLAQTVVLFLATMWMLRRKDARGQ